MMKHALALIGLVLLTATAWVQDTPARWLQRAAQAEKNLNVAGVRVTEFQLGNRVERVRERFWRRGEDAIRVEVLEPESFRGDVLIHRSGKWLRFKSGSQEAYEVPFLPGQWSDDLLERATELLQAGILSATMRPDENLLGRTVAVLQLRLERPEGRPPRFGAPPRRPPEEPPGLARKRPFPFRATLWIDKATGLCLKHELELRPGAPLVRSEIVRLELNPRLSPDLFQVPEGVVVRRLGENEYTSLEETERAVGFRLRLPEYLPVGTVRERILVQPRGPRRMQMVAIRYRTPQGSFTLFQARRPERGSAFRPPAPPARENLNAHFWQEGDYWFGIVGSLPKAELERIAQSIR
ncbi:MAG: hypothetical protein SNJ72_00180 [Fimbriimonadales bacterium]